MTRDWLDADRPKRKEAGKVGATYLHVAPNNFVTNCQAFTTINELSDVNDVAAVALHLSNQELALPINHDPSRI